MNNWDELSFTVTDLKQYIYCPRIFFYQACLPDIRPTTAKMAHGVAAHEAEQKRAARRSLQQYHLLEGNRRFDVAIQSENYHLNGVIDEVVDTPDGSFPVDYKLAKRAGFHFKIQLTAYALLLEEQSNQKIKQGYLYLMQTKQMETVRFTKKLRQTVIDALQAMWSIAQMEILPPPTDSRPRCADCEFRRFCNDV